MGQSCCPQGGGAPQCTSLFISSFVHISSGCGVLREFRQSTCFLAGFETKAFRRHTSRSVTARITSLEFGHLRTSSPAVLKTLQFSVTRSTNERRTTVVPPTTLTPLLSFNLSPFSLLWRSYFLNLRARAHVCKLTLCIVHAKTKMTISHRFSPFQSHQMETSFHPVTCWLLTGGGADVTKCRNLSRTFVSLMRAHLRDVFTDVFSSTFTTVWTFHRLAKTAYPR